MTNPQREIRYGKYRYKEAPARLHFPLEERVPETPRHLNNRTELWQCACEGLAERGVLASDQFVFWDPTDPQKRLAPDFFIRLGLPARPPEQWRTWDHGHPDLAVEVISASDARDTPWQAKLGRYRQVAIKELIRFDAEDAESPLRVWDWQEGDLLERHLEHPGWAESRLLPGIFFVVVKHPAYGPWLRLSRDPEGHDLLLSPQERAQKEAERAQKEAERADRAEKQARDAEMRARKEMLLTLVHVRGLLLSPAERGSIEHCQDTAVLEQWFARAATATTLSEVFLES